MNWKEFFKLRISNVVIFVVLGIIAFLTSPVKVVCITAPCPPLYTSSFSKVVHLLLAFPFELLNQTVFAIIINTVYLYLFSILIIFVYEKLRIRFRSE